ncbi:unnamed protein product [Arctogadus glacialis]
MSPLNMETSLSKKDNPGEVKGNQCSVCTAASNRADQGSVVKVERKGLAFVQRSFEEFHKLHCKLRLICRVSPAGHMSSSNDLPVDPHDVPDLMKLHRRRQEQEVSGLLGGSGPTGSRCVCRSV